MIALNEFKIQSTENEDEEFATNNFSITPPSNKTTNDWSNDFNWNGRDDDDEDLNLEKAPEPSVEKTQLNLKRPLQAHQINKITDNLGSSYDIKSIKIEKTSEVDNFFNDMEPIITKCEKNFLIDEQLPLKNDKFSIIETLKAENNEKVTPSWDSDDIEV